MEVEAPPASDRPSRWPRRWPALLAVLLAVGGVAALGFGSLRLVAAGSLRDQAETIEAETAKLRASEAAARERLQERTAATDRIRDANASLSGGVIKILRSSAAVLSRYNAMIDAFNRSVDAYNVGNISGSTAIIEDEVAPAIADVSDAVRRQGRALAGVRRGLSALEETLG